MHLSSAAPCKVFQDHCIKGGRNFILAEEMLGSLEQD